MPQDYARSSQMEPARPVDNEDFLVVLVRIAEALESIQQQLNQITFAIEEAR